MRNCGTSKLTPFLRMAIPALIALLVPCSEFAVAQDTYLLCTDWGANINYIDVPDAGESFTMRQVLLTQAPFDGVFGRCGRWLAMGDFDGDDDQDFVVAVLDVTQSGIPGQGSTKIYVYEKTSDGMNFATPVHLFTLPFTGLQNHSTAYHKPTAVDDFNNDGNLDFIIDLQLDSDRLRGPVQMFLGNGDLTFAPYQELNEIIWGNGIVATDVDGDRTVDLICGNIYGVTAGDYDGDGYVDVIEDGERGFQVYLGNGDGTFFHFNARFWGTQIRGEKGDWLFYRGLGNGNFQAGRRMSGNRQGYLGTRWNSPLVTFQAGGTDDLHIACNRDYYPIVQHYSTAVGLDANGIWKDSVTFEGDIWGGSPASTGMNRRGLQSANLPLAPAGSPHPAVVPRQQVVKVGEVAQLDGSGSYDTDNGSIVSYDWNYADGTTGAGVHAPHVYSVEGMYRVGLKTTDDDGKFRSAYAEVVAQGDPPIAVIDMPTWAPPLEQVQMDGSGSTDDFGVKLYYWDFGDGYYGSTQPIKYPIAWHSYKEPGIYTVTLTVYDAAGQTSIATATILISDEPPPNTPPVANAGVAQIAECSSGDGKADITLDGFGSSDPDGDPLSYTWSGPFGTALGIAPLVEVPMGMHTITLTVEDGKGGIDQDDVLITVQDISPPKTAAAIVGDPGNDGWYVSPMIITLEAADSCAGVNEMWYSLNGVAVDAPNPVQVTLTDGVHVLQFRATDQTGNVEGTQELNLSVDLTGPEVVISGVEEGATYELGLVPEATYQVTDATSGVASSSATLTGGDDYGLGEFVYSVSAEDNAGNSSVLSVNYIVIGGIAGMTALLDEYETSGDLDAQFAIGLRRSLNDALNAPNPTAQTRMLGDFINKVGRQTGKKITAEAAAVLIHAAEYVINENLVGAEASRMVSSELIQAQNTPNQFELSSPYPNPFNPTTEIPFALPVASHVSLNVYNIMGQRVATLVDGHLQEGWHTVNWDGSDSPSGMYFYRMIAGVHVATQKMVLLK